MPTSQEVLIIEDDPDIGALVAMQARSCAATVRVETNGLRGLLAAQDPRWDLIVLDWALPGMDGLTLCQRLRAQDCHTPILMLTARVSEEDHVQGLDAGADDFVTKPFSLREVQARIRAQLRHAARRFDEKPTPGLVREIEVARFGIDETAQTATCDGRLLPLTEREFELLRHFAQHPNRVFSRDQLLRAVWGTGFDGFEHTVNSHINRLRAKIETDVARPRFLVTVWGRGYRFSPDGA